MRWGQGVVQPLAQGGRPGLEPDLNILFRALRLPKSSMLAGVCEAKLFLGVAFRYNYKVFRIAIFEDSFIEVSGP